ncbi:MAG TPA: nitrate reductase associated protein [Cyanobacteria bacterium UBA11162]|nr:nitrate reductase associated protein [Cyanobacteria bacterium UBA11162]
MTNNQQPTTNNNFFQFEADFVDSLRCIPMQVRMKLDNCGVKLKLTHWHQFTQEERQRLVEMPGTTASESEAYRQYLQQLVINHTGTPASELPIDPHPAWMDRTKIPPSIQEKAQEFGQSLTIQQWEALIPAQRFALIKLSRPSHENKNFLSALKEFKIVKSES